MNKKGLLLVLGTAIISGFSVFVNKFGVSFSDPVAYTFFKNICVALVISGIIFYLTSFKQFKKINRKDWLKLVAIGVIGGSIPFILFFKGLSMTSAAQGAFIHKSMFILVAILAWGFLREKIRMSFFIGGGLLFLGNLFFLKSLEINFSQGDWLILAATLFWAVENIISKKALASVDWKMLVWSRMTFGSLIIFGYLILSGGVQNVFSLNLQQAGWAVISALFLFGYQATWYGGLKYVPVSVATSILLLGSTITTFLGFIQKGQVETQSLLASSAIILGVLVILFSGILAQKARKMFHYVRG